MKKTYKILILIFFILFGIVFTKFYGMYEYGRSFTGRYDSAINLTIVDEISQVDVLESLKEYGNRYNMDIERSITFPGDGKNKKSLTSYVHINNFDWFNDGLIMKDGNKFNFNLQKGEFLSNIKTKDKYQVGQISIFDDNSQELYIRPLGDMRNRVVESTYNLHLNNDNYTVNEIIDIINDEQGAFSVQKDSKAEVYADVNIYYMYGIFIVLFFILFLAMILFMYNIIAKNKSIGLKKLYGYSNFKITSEIFKKDILKPVIISNIISILLITILVYFKNSFAGFKQYITMFLLVLLAIDFLLLIVLTVIALIFKGKKNIQLLLKGRRKNILALNILMKIIISTIVILTLLLNINIFDSYRTKNANLQDWDKAKNLGLIGVNFSNLVDISDNIKFYPYAVKLGDLWNDINDNGGIMAGYAQLFRSDLIEKEKMPPNLGHGMLINENYLKHNIVKDEYGSRITTVDDDNDTLTVLVPSQFKEKEKLIKDGIRFYHLGNYDLEYYSYKQKLEIVEGIREDGREIDEFIEYTEKEYSFLKQKIIYTEDNQKYFTYDMDEIDLYKDDFKEYYNEIDNSIRDSILVVMSNDNLKEARKYDAVMSGLMKFRFEDYKYPEEGIIPLLEKNELLDGLSYLSTVYDYVADDIKNIGTLLALSIGISIICILIILGLTYQESLAYLYKNSRRISVMKLYGFNFFKRYKSYFIMISIVDSIIMIISAVLVYVFLYYFADTFNGANNLYYLLIVLGILFYIVDLVITYLLLTTRENKSIINDLKGELE